MSDVELARAGWLGKTIFFVGVGIMSLWDMMPVVVKRGTYRRLIDNQFVIDDATRILNEYRRLRNTYEPDGD